MTEFLSDEWIAALDARLSAGDGSSPETLTIQYDITTASELRTYHLVLGPDQDRAIAGPADAPDVTFAMDDETAAAISSGELSTEEAFITGKLDIDGDTGRLLDAYRASTEG